MTDKPHKPDRRDIRIPKERPMTPAEGAPIQSWREETTGVHTDQVFRALKALGEDLEKNKLEAAKAHGALKQELVEMKTSVDTRLTKQDHVLADQSNVLSRMAGQLDVLVPMARKRPDSAETKALVDTAIENSGVVFRRKIILQIITGVFSAGVLGAVIHWLVS